MKFNFANLPTSPDAATLILFDVATKARWLLTPLVQIAFILLVCHWLRDWLAPLVHFIRATLPHMGLLDITCLMVCGTCLWLTMESAVTYIADGSIGFMKDGALTILKFTFGGFILLLVGIVALYGMSPVDSQMHNRIESLVVAITSYVASHFTVDRHIPSPPTSGTIAFYNDVTSFFSRSLFGG
jgi:uncharacterized protein YggT (Ycf19 family)